LDKSESRVRQGELVPRVTLDPQDPSDSRERSVSWDQRALLARLETRDNRARTAHKDPRVPKEVRAPQGHQGRPEITVPLEVRGLMALSGRAVWRELPDQQDQLVPLGLQDRAEVPDHREELDRQELLDCWVIRDPLDQTDSRDQTGYQELLDPPDHKVSLEVLDNRELLESPALLETPDLPVPWDRTDPRDLPDPLVLAAHREPLDLPGHQDLQGTRDLREPREDKAPLEAWERPEEVVLRDLPEIEDSRVRRVQRDLSASRE